MSCWGVIGGGAWGTACAQALAAAGREVTLYAREAEVAASINSEGRNRHYLSGVELSPAITATDDMAGLAGCEAVLSVVPAQFTRGALEAFATHARDGLPVVLCSKGIEVSTHSFMSDVLAETIPQAVPAVLAGPSFAADVARGRPAAVTMACADEAVLQTLVEGIGSPGFRLYYSRDVLGAEIGGAVKNVLAIVCGIVLGRELGRSAHAAVIARGFAEMRRFGVALGAEPETLLGMCGLGDLVLTCSSEQSRNMSCGLALGRGQPLEDVLAASPGVVEGVATAPVLQAMARNVGVEMPLCFAAAEIIAGRLSVEAAMVALTQREPKAEADL